MDFIRKMKKIFIEAFAALLIVSGSCVEPVVMDPMEEMPVVVSCVLTRNGLTEYDVRQRPYDVPTQKLTLFYAKRPTESGYKYITDAKITVSGGGEEYEFTWNGECWCCAFLPKFDTEYTLRIVMGNGKELLAKTVYPKAFSISGTPIYSDVSNIAFAQYYQVVLGNDAAIKAEEAYLWITAPEGRSDISNFCTDHPGADDSNIVPGAWNELPVAQELLHNYNGLLQFSISQKADKKYWQLFLNKAYGLPLHRNYLHIRHSIDAYDWPEGALVSRYDSYDGLKESSVKYGFVLSSDHVEYHENAVRWIGPARVSPASKIRFVSKEYDKYLSVIANSFLHTDELAQIYFSSESTYTNVEGGMGIFGAEF